MMELYVIFTLFLLFMIIGMYFYIEKKYYFGWIRNVKSDVKIMLYI